MQHIFHVKEKLDKHRFVGAKQLRILLVDLFHACRAGHPLGEPRNDGCYRISRHQARQDKIQHERAYKGDDEPNQLV
jgi:hypothetical protein